MKLFNFFLNFIINFFIKLTVVLNLFWNFFFTNFKSKVISLILLIIIVGVTIFFYFEYNYYIFNNSPKSIINPELISNCNDITEEDVRVYTFNSTYFFPLDINIIDLTTQEEFILEEDEKEIFLDTKKNLYYNIYESLTNNFFFLPFTTFIFPSVANTLISLEASTWDINLFKYFIRFNNINLDNQIYLNILEDLNSSNSIYNFSTFKLFQENSSQFISIFDLLTVDNTNESVHSSILMDDFLLKNLKNRVINEFFFTHILSFYLKKKILLFFFLNFLILFLMLINLTKLYKAINLIYSLLHFLLFATLSGILILLWGSSYIAFCVLLIYGAAIPVLALYIIMLVNVDLIQRLFFFEHISSNLLIERKKKIFIFIFFTFFLFFSFSNVTFELNNLEFPWLFEMYKNIFYLNLSEKYISSNHFSYKTSSIFDLVLSFYSSDLDKVASAAFKVSFNELIALVFLLLIAIIVVISISWTQAKTNKYYYENILPDFSKFKKFFDFRTTETLYRIFYVWRLNNFIIAKSLHEMHGAKLHSLHNPIFLYHYTHNTVDFSGFDPWTIDMHTWLVVDPDPDNPKDPWTFWYRVYSKDKFRDELEEKPEVRKFLGTEILIRDRESFTAEEYLFYRITHRVVI